MTWIALLEGWGKNILAGQYLPITVTTAIVLFVVKQLLEIHRKRQERLRKMNAAKLLLSQELEKNHWSLVSFFRILDEMKKAETEAPRAVFSLHVARNGAEHFRMKEEPDDESESGSWIATFHTAVYEKHLSTLAEYDQALYKVVNEAYGEIFELIHYRETLTSFLAGESIAPVGLTRHFLSNMAAEKDDYYKALNKSYLALTGNDLKEWRLR
jgi:hypothetical protein